MSRSEHFLEAVWQRRGLAGRVGYLALRPLSEVFGAAVGLRNLALPDRSPARVPGRAAGDQHRQSVGGRHWQDAVHVVVQP